MLIGRNVLIFHAGALGDFILTWPIAVALARLHPQSRIFYATHGGQGKLAEKALGVDSVDIDIGWHPLHGDADQLSADNQKLLKGAHTVVSFVSDGRDAWAKNVSKLAPQANVVFIRTPPRGTIPGGFEVSEFFLEQLDEHAAMHTAVQQILRSIADRGIGGRGKPDGRTLIHPGSGSDGKCWPIDRFMELAEQLKAAGRDVACVVGEAEMARLPANGVAQLRATAPVHQPANLVELYQLTRQAAAFVGNDSGPGHLAGILGIPTTVIFGSKGLHSWKPLGPTVKAVEADSIDDVTVDQVVQTVTE